MNLCCAKLKNAPRFLGVAGEVITRNETSAGAFSRPRGGDLDMRHRLPDPSAWRRRFLGQRLTARFGLSLPRPNLFGRLHSRTLKTT